MNTVAHAPAPSTDVALALAADGLAVFPLAKGTKRPLQGSHGFKDATRDERQLRAWWSGGTDHDPGIATGARSRILVVDIDDPVKAAAFFARHPALPATRTVLTGRPGGRHLYFALPVGVTVPSFTPTGSGINVKCEGGYVAGPGARHPSGAVYRGEDPTVPIAPCPAWLLALGRPGVTRTSPRTSARAERRRGIYRLEVGERRPGLTERAGYYRFRGATEAQARGLLHQDNRELCYPPVPTAWVDAIVTSVWKYSPSLKAVLRDGATLDDTKALAYVAEVEAAIAAASWGGRTGATDLAVLLAFLIIARRSRFRLFEVDYRTIADMAGESLGTTWRAVQKRLVAKGWLVDEVPYEPLDDPHRGTVWRLKAVHSSGTEPQREEGRSCSTSVHPLVAALLNHDAFRRKKNALFLLGDLIANGPATGNQLSRGRGVHRNTVGAHMKMLAAHGLVGKNNKGQWMALVAADVETLKPRLDEVAQARGTAGMGERQWLRHLRERCLFRDRVRAMGWGRDAIDPDARLACPESESVRVKEAA